MIIKSTKDIKVSNKIADQVIGQDEGLELVKKAAKQRRNLLLIGNPGTGKSLLGQALAELIPKEKLSDIIALPNGADENAPLIRIVPKGQGKDIIAKAKIQNLSSFKNQTIIFFIFVLISLFAPWWIRKQYGDIMAAASLIGSMIFLAAFIFFINIGRRMKTSGGNIPKLLIDNSSVEKAPFLDGTGAHSGALLGDVLHDPLQSFYNQTVVNKIINNKGLKQIQKIELTSLLNPLFDRKKLITKESYEAFLTEKEELFTLGEQENKINDVEVLSANRYLFDGKLIKLTTASGKELLVTPEHKIAVSKFGKIKYKEAQKLTRFDKVITNEEI